MPEVNALGAFLKQYIDEHRISINDIATKMDVPHSTVGRWVKGKTTPELELLNKLSAIINVPLCYLVELIYPQPPRRVDPSDIRLAEQIGELPEEGKRAVEALALGFSLKNTNRDADKS